MTDCNTTIDYQKLNISLLQALLQLYCDAVMRLCGVEVVLHYVASANPMAERMHGKSYAQQIVCRVIDCFVKIDRCISPNR